MDGLNKELNTNEAVILKRTFEQIGNNIINDLDKRINDYSNSLLFKYYSSLYYFLPKSCLLEVKDKGHNGYYIYPNEHFFIEDKRTNKVLTYSTKSENIVLPIQEIKTIKQNETSLNLSISFYNHFEYDNLTIWLDPELCIQNPFLATYIFNQIISNSGTAKIEFSSHSYATRDIEIKPINIQLRPTEMLILNLHLPSLMYGFNIKIKDLFKYKNDDFKKIDLFLKVIIDNYPEEKINSLFKANLIPVFNSFNDYSNSTTALINFSNIKLTHYKKDDAQAIEVLSVYENNKQCDFDNFLFSGLNEYYFNRNTQSLNYNVAFPQLTNKIVETKVHTYATWTQITEISDIIEISSNAITSINSNISPVIINNAIHNYNHNSMFNIVDMLISKNIYSKTTFLAIAKLLKVDTNNISFLSELLQNVEVNLITNELILTTTGKYNKKHKHFLYFFVNIICKFISQNTFCFIKKIVLNDSR